MKLLFISILSLFFHTNSFCQGSISLTDKVINYQLPTDTALQNALSQASGFSSLSAEEKQVAYILNYARKNPQIFLQKAINNFLFYHPEVKSTYTTSLQMVFKSQPALPVILFTAGLSKVARSHAADLSMHHIISHQSSNGQSFQQRVSNWAQVCASECIYASSRFNAIEAILSLLFDFNVPDLGHRKSLLDAKFTRGGFGVYIGNATTNSLVVIDLSCE